MTTYLMAGGGTAGHVNPLLATADRLRERDPSAEILVLGTEEGLEARLVPERGYELLVIPRLPFPRRPNRAALSFPKNFRASIDRTREYLRERKVDVVVGFGGYASAPAYVAAHREGVPIAIHEANAKPGIANRLGARYTKHVGVAFRGTRLRGATWVGQPLRVEIERIDRFSARREGLAHFGLEESKPTLLVTGGSSGAKRINDTIAQSIATILGTGWQVIHVAGAFRDEAPPSQLPGYVVRQYIDRMDLALAVADLSIGRAGTSTVAELTALGIPAVFVPYASGNGEQRLNAREAVAAGGAIVVKDSDFTPDWVARELVPLLSSRARIADMAARMATVGALDGSDRMADLVEQAAADGVSRA